MSLRDRFRPERREGQAGPGRNADSKALTRRASGLFIGRQMATLLKLVAGQDLNLRPSGYEPDELPDCSTPRLMRESYIILKCCAAHRPPPGFDAPRRPSAAPAHPQQMPQTGHPARRIQAYQLGGADGGDAQHAAVPHALRLARIQAQRRARRAVSASGASMSRLPLRQTMLAPARSRNVREAPPARSRRVVRPGREWGS